MGRLLVVRLLFAAAAAAPDVIPLDQAVQAIADQNLARATAAVEETSVYQHEVQSDESLILSRLAAKQSEDALKDALPVVPEARKAATVAKLGRRNAATAAKEAEESAEEAKLIAKRAVAKASQWVLAEVEREAHASAVAAAKETLNHKKHLADAATAAAANAMEVYHLAMLRAQKSVATIHAKAVSAMNNAKKIMGKANALAKQAQAFQDAGQPYYAQQFQTTAVNMSMAAKNLQQQAFKMYDTAQNLAGGIVGYQMNMKMAGANAAALAALNPPMEFPEEAPALVQAKQALSRQKFLG
mmetsp:Transcript_37751/g.82666  ORF Transcript_37751/g.82666 Transcript_37751/m.82666 type:complete len:300 (+) Transcript_37751:36-935(+)